MKVGSQQMMMMVLLELFLKFIYVCIFGCAESLLLHRLFSSCGTQDSHCAGFSCCGAPALGHTGPSSCGTWALERRLSSGGALT